MAVPVNGPARFYTPAGTLSCPPARRRGGIAIVSSHIVSLVDSMSRHKSPEEVEQERSQVLGPQLGPLFHALHDEFAWLQMKWQEYRKLFAHTRERVELLNQTARTFFWILQDVLWKDVLLHLARLVDASSTGRKTNLTIQALPASIADPTLAADVERLVGEAVARCDFAKDWRNRSLAHNDLNLRLDRATQPLEGVSREHVETALKAVADVLNRIELHYFKVATDFSRVVLTDDAESLVFHLGVAVKAEERERRERRERWSPRERPSQE